VTQKYDELADRFTEHEYGDPERYFGHRATIVVTVGPRLEPGDRILDLACADGSAAPPLIARGLRYTGVDASEAMLEIARTRVPAAEFVAGDLLTYSPPEPVAATTIFRSLHFVEDRTTFFRHVASFTEKKLVFDFAPRRHSPADVHAELSEAGFGRVAFHPFFVSQHTRLPRPVANLLVSLERTPLARLLLHVRFSYVCAASR
jgi:ubiquinone/menaquinone biosynthesis C-methylase UbiE